MTKQVFRVGELSKILGVNIQTLRRWDESGKLIAERTSDDGHRIYSSALLEEHIEGGSIDCLKMCKAWAEGDGSWNPIGFLHSPTSAMFANRLHKLEQRLSRTKDLNIDLSLITSMVGEIGNNSYDHNLGNWSDVQGIFFGYDLEKGYVVLADRGQGILTTLKRVRPALQTHEEALRVGFTEILSGRAPENRGNGLKYVRKLAIANDLHLSYQSGDAYLELELNEADLPINSAITPIQGCMAIIKF